MLNPLRTAKSKLVKLVKGSSSPENRTVKRPAAKKVIWQHYTNPNIANYETLVASGEYEMVYTILQRYLADQPLDPRATALMGHCKLRMSNYAAAVSSFENAEAMGGYVLKDCQAWAEALCGLGKFDDARTLLLSAMGNNPTAWQLYWDYAALVENMDHYLPFYDFCRNLRSQAPVSDAIERALAKAATLVDDFESANSIYRRLIAVQMKRLEKQSSEPQTIIPAIEKIKTNDLEDGKGEACLKGFKDVMQSANIPFFLMAGTVLGYIRDGRLLPGDKDVDIGIMEKDYDKTKIENLLRDSGSFQIKRVDDHADRIRAIYRNGVWVDVFPYFTEGKRTWHAGTVARWWHEPFDLAPYDVDGTSFMIPADTDAYLEENYGSDWRTPDGLFDVYDDAPNAEIMHHDFLRYSTWRKIFESLKVRNWEKVLKYVNKNPDLIKENPWLVNLRLLAENQVKLQEVAVE